MPEPTTVSLPQLNPYPLDQALPVDLVFIWNAAAGELQVSSVSQLLGVPVVPDPAPVALASPFKVYNNSGTYAFAGGNTVITDMRMIDKTDFIVRNTKFNTDFKKSQMLIDPVAGSVTLYGFELDDADDYVSIYVDGSVSQAAQQSYQALSTRLDDHDAMLIIFKPTALGGTGAIIPWYRPMSEIPLGWTPVANMDGRILINIDATSGIFNVIFNKGGAPDHTLTVDELPAHSHSLFAADVSGANGAIPGPTDGVARARSNGDNDTSSRLNYELEKSVDPATLGQSSETGAGADIDIMNPYVVVCYLEYTGI